MKLYVKIGTLSGEVVTVPGRKPPVVGDCLILKRSEGEKVSVRIDEIRDVGGRDLFLCSRW